MTYNDKENNCYNVLGNKDIDEKHDTDSDSMNNTNEISSMKKNS